MPDAPIRFWPEPLDHGIHGSPRSDADRQQVTQHGAAGSGASGQLNHVPARGHLALRADPGTDPVQPVGTGLDGVSRHAKRPAQHVFQLMLLALRMAHDSRSKTERRAAMAREVWPLTAPGVIPIAAAVSASDSSP